MAENWSLHNADSYRWLLDYSGEPFAAVVTDPPYSSGGATRGDRMVATSVKYLRNDSSNCEILPEFLGDTRDQRGFVSWCALWMSAALAKSEPGAVAFFFCDWRQLPAMTDAVQAGGWVWRGIVPWNKGEQTRPQRGRPRAQCEYSVFCTNGPHAPWEGAPVIPGFFDGSSPRERIHITEKPVGMLRQIMRLVRPGGLVLDPFVGSGAHGIAALAEGRRFVGCELSKEIADLAEQRIRAWDDGQSLADRQAGQAAIFVGTT